MFHEEIFNLCYYSSGGFPFRDVYDLSVDKRKFFLRLLEVAKENEKQAVENAQQPGTIKGESPYPTPQRFKNMIIPKK
jgi:hypothetical protein